MKFRGILIMAAFAALLTAGCIFPKSNRFRTVSSGGGVKVVALDSFGVQLEVTETARLHSMDATEALIDLGPLYGIIVINPELSGKVAGSLDGAIKMSKAELSRFELVEKETFDNGYDFIFSYYHKANDYAIPAKQTGYISEIAVGDKRVRCAMFGQSIAMLRRQAVTGCRSLQPAEAPPAK